MSARRSLLKGADERDVVMPYFTSIVPSRYEIRIVDTASNADLSTGKQKRQTYTKNYE